MNLIVRMCCLLAGKDVCRVSAMLPAQPEVTVIS